MLLRPLNKFVRQKSSFIKRLKFTNFVLFVEYLRQIIYVSQLTSFMLLIHQPRLLPGACLRTNWKYAGGGYGRGFLLPYVRKKIKIWTKWWLILHLSEPIHRLNCFQNKSEKQSKWCAKTRRKLIIYIILANEFWIFSVFKDLTLVRHVFIAFFTI